MNIINPTSITEWFRKSDAAVPSHFNQSVMLRAAKRLNPYTMKETLRLLCTYHDMLRAYWDGSQLAVREQTCPKLVLFEEHDLRRSSDVNGDVMSISDTLQSTIDLGAGPLVHASLFHLPEYDAVLLAIHHLVVDGVSWRIIIEDLNSIYPQLLAGSFSARLPRIRCTFGEYAEEIHKYASSEALLQELPYWTEISGTVRSVTGERDVVSGEYDNISFTIDADTTRRILTECNKKYAAEVNDILLTALSRAWKDAIGQEKIALSMEGHGREPFGEKPLPLERIVGWFTTIYPAVLDCTAEDITEHVKQTTDALHSIPNKGFGYGTLLHIAHKTELECHPQITFNYLGSFEEGESSDQLFSIDNELPRGREVSELNKGDVPLSLNCLTVKGCLTGSFGYDTGIYSQEQIENLKKAFIAQLELL